MKLWLIYMTTFGVEISTGSVSHGTLLVYSYH
jgi:hypothetical protein